MRILDEKGNELVDPDLDKGYLKDDTLTKYHPAVAESPEEFELIVVWENPDDPTNKLTKKVITKPYSPAKPAWNEVENVYRYILYTPEELAAFEAEKEAFERSQLEAEKEAKRKAELQARIEALPDQVEILNEAVAEAGVVIGENDEILSSLQSDVSDLMEAVAEIGTLVAGE